MCGKISMKEGEYLSYPVFSVVLTKPFLWWVYRLGSRPLGGRHASVVPALPDEYESHLNNIRGGRRDDEGGDAEEDPARPGTSFPCIRICKPMGSAHTTLVKMVMDITKSLVAVQTWHSRLPLHNVHTVVPHIPRFYKETSSSSLWIRILRCRLRTLRTGQRCLQASRAS